MDALGIIFSNIHDNNVPELTMNRTIGAIPFGGRYRLIDFALSNMVNSGITTVGLMTSNNYRSLIDHIGSGKDWDLARKDGGLILLPPFSEKHDKLYTTRLEALCSLTGFLSRRNEKYVVLADCDGVAKFNIADILDYHEEKNADITLVTKHGKVGRRSDFLLVSADENGRVNEIQHSPHLADGTKSNIFINVIFMCIKYYFKT